ncbi:hypothetical protein GC169_05255 [bacterium]|nr:hypothetical protein [bacterium]
MTFKAGLVCAAAIMAAGCAATPTTGGAPLFTGGNVQAVANMAIPGGCPTSSTLTSSITAVCRGVDLASLALNRSSRPQFNYAENDDFDLQLNASMKGGVPTIKAITPASESLTVAELEAATVPSADSPRLSFWLAKIRATGGQNLVCQEETDGAESAFAWMVASMAADWLTDWLTYKPAEAYHSIVYVRPIEGTEELRVVRTEFLSRASNPNPVCPA